MEELVRKMQNMFKKTEKYNESDKYLFFSSKYNPIVKVSEWYLPLEAEPKDNDPYHPPGGDYFVSTYRRFGTQDCGTMESETHAMLRQICDLKPQDIRHKPLVNFSSDRLLSEGESEEHNVYHGFEGAHFTTTYNYEYRVPFPYKKIRSMKMEDKPKQSFGLSSKYSPTKICETKFLDDEYFADLKSKTVKSYKLEPPYQTDNSMVSGNFC